MDYAARRKARNRVRLVPDLGEIGDGEEFEWVSAEVMETPGGWGRRRREFREGPSRVAAHGQASDGGGPSCERS